MTATDAEALGRLRDSEEFARLQTLLADRYQTVRPAHPSGLAAWAVAALTFVQGERDAFARDAAIGRLVREKMVSGNEIPVERCVIRADEIAALARQEPT